MLLQAILEDDQGHALEEQGDHAGAHQHFVKALELAKGAGGETQKDWLKVSRYYVCSGPDSAQYCQ